MHQSSQLIRLNILLQVIIVNILYQKKISSTEQLFFRWKYYRWQWSWWYDSIVYRQYREITCVKYMYEKQRACSDSVTLMIVMGAAVLVVVGQTPFSRLTWLLKKVMQKHIFFCKLTSKMWYIHVSHSSAVHMVSCILYPFYMYDFFRENRFIPCSVFLPWIIFNTSSASRQA